MSHNIKEYFGSTATPPNMELQVACISNIPSFMDTEKYRYYALTIKKVNYTLQFLRDYWFKQSAQVIISQEEAKEAGKHFHLFISIDKNENMGSDNKIYKQKIKSELQELSTKFAFQMAEVKTIEYASYVLKDGMYYHQGIPQIWIDNMYEKSYKKYDKVTFAKEWDNIYFNKDYTVQQKLMDYVKLKHRYKQKVSRRHLDDIHFDLCMRSQKFAHEYIQYHYTDDKYFRD